VIPDVRQLTEPAPPRRPWEPVDLGPVLSGQYAPPMLTVGARADGPGLFYPGRVHSLASESEAGKTWLALAAVRHELDKGNAAVYLDFEDDEGGVVGRLLALGAKPADIASRFAYLRPDAPVTEGENRSDLVHALDDLDPTLAVIDGVTEAMSLHGLELRDNGEVAEFGKLLPRFIAGHGPAVVTLDHVTKDREGRGRYALGAQHKLAGLNGAAYVLENRQPFGIGVTGRSSVFVAKDRPGQLRRHALPGRGGLAWFADLVVDSTAAELVDASLDPPAENDGPFRPTVLMGRVADALTRAAEPLTTRGVLDRVTGKQDAIRHALACLIDDGYVAVETGPRSARLHRLARPYPETP
jgi:hypothetical protein